MLFPLLNRIALFRGILRIACVAGVLMFLLAAAPSLADEPRPPSPSTEATIASEPSSFRDERALALLKRMSATLAKAGTMSFKARSIVPLPAPNGQWISLIGGSRVVLKRPDKLFIETRGDFFPYDLFYDGKTVTAYAPQHKAYAQKEAPPSLDAALKAAAEAGEVEFPFADLLMSDPYTALTEGVRDALYIGQTTIGGVLTDHLAVRGKDIEWQIWIGVKDHLPRAVTVTALNVAGLPTHWMEFSDWKLGTKVASDTFTFRNASKATKIPFRKPGMAKPG